MLGRAWGAAGVLAVVALALAPALPGQAGGRVLAHAQLVASAPGAGEVLAEPPAELRLVFSERLEATGTSVDIRDAGGASVVQRAGGVDPVDPYVLVVPLPSLDDGAYSVAWRTLSADDGHPTEGFLTFGVGEVAEGDVSGAASGHDHPGPGAVAVAARWLTYPGMLAAIGVPLFHRVALRAGPMPRPLRRLLGAGLLLAAAATLVAAARAGLEVGDPVGYLGTRNGLLLLARALVTGAGGAVVLFGRRRMALPSALVAGLAATLLHVMAGHASALPGIAGLLVQWAHVVAAGVWAGGVVALVVLLARPHLLVEEGDRPDMRAIVPRFSALALVGIGLTGLTGIHAAWSQAGTLLDPTTDYGATLLLKTTFAVAALALGGLNFLDGGRMRGWLDGMRARVSLEAIVIATVLGGSALLAVTPPRDQAGGVAIEPLPDAFGLVAPDMALEIVPGRPGVNRAVVTTGEELASMSLSLSLDRLDATGTTRVPLRLESNEGGSGHAHGTGAPAASSEGEGANWVADALLLPPGSEWDTTVRIAADADGPELTRQRFAFQMGDEEIREGRMVRWLDPGLIVGIALLVLGALAVGGGLGGARLPRTDPSASGSALVVGGLAATVIGAGIGMERLLGV